MKARRWSLISLLLFVAAIFFWLKGNERQARQAPAAATNQPPAPVGSTAAVPAPRTPRFTLLTRRLPPTTLPASGAQDTVAASAPAPSAPPDAPATPRERERARWRLRNTAKPVADLMKSEAAILLRNAFIDTGGERLAVPEHLRAGDDPGAYLVQARGAIDEAFRAQLHAHGATVVSYVPNNAYLVTLAPDGARSLASAPRVKAVWPYEPYYKLDPQLLPLAVEKQPLPEGSRVAVTGYPEQPESTRSVLEGLGATVLAEGRTPFGPQYIVEPQPESLVTLACSPLVQLLEPYVARAPMNDLTRVSLGVAEDTVVTNNYLGLTGSNVWVNVNDSGIDERNPDLKDRVFGDGPAALVDAVGHGTHVAGVIASSGEHGPTGTNVPSGSVTNANFRGLAPKAKLFSMSVDLATGPVISDSYLQETAARTNYQVLNRTNALISNNSWAFPKQFEYNSSAATYDAAVRDALPDMPGSQPILYVFAAGNGGAGNNIGQGGEPGSVAAPATAKNVITVGAAESARFITNAIIFGEIDLVLTNQDGTLTTNRVANTNQIWYAQTDTNNEVAAYSARGNVGIGEEGPAGRFKPDLVAPGAFITSTRPIGWLLDTNPIIRDVNYYSNQLVLRSDLNFYSINVITNSIRLTLETLPNPKSPRIFPGLPIYARFGDFADSTNYDRLGTNRLVLRDPQVGSWYYSVGNPLKEDVNFDLRTTLEVQPRFGNYWIVLSNMNEQLKPNYRFDSGTSASAASISGLLALLEEFFEQRKLTYTPALLKALLINGSRSLGPQYTFQVRNLINYQGWGQPNLASILPSVITNSTDMTKWPVQWPTNQSSTNALATGKSHRFDLQLPPEAENGDLRVTLVWTDPPGNPTAAIKLVNDLDLILSNKVTGELYAGNDIPAGRDFNRVISTNNTPLFDTVNNVENIFLRHPGGTNYGVHVLGRRVNVNAVTAHTNAIVQDYALVVSLTVTNGFKFTYMPTNNVSENVEVTFATNGLPLLHQLAGANSPLLGGSAGVSNQWHFYKFINSTNYSVEGITNGQYVAFVTFMPPDLSHRPGVMSPTRRVDADIDMYVVRNPSSPTTGDDRLLSLQPAALAGAFTSRNRGGTELVTFTNATIDEVFYVGIKAEDQMGGEYGFVALSSDRPFEENLGGRRLLHGLPYRAVIPDGSPVDPGAALVFAIGISSSRLAHVVVSNTFVHNQFGDLVGNLSHGNKFVVLNNHSLNVPPRGPLGERFLFYDDSRAGESLDSLRTDGPGTLRNFLGDTIAGPWILTVIDNSLGHTGLVQNVNLVVEPNPDLRNGVRAYVLANEFKDYFIDVPPDATNMVVNLTETDGLLNLYLRRGDYPTFTAYDKAALISPPGGALTNGLNDVPPLTAGRYYIGIYNPTANTVNFRLFVTLDRDLAGVGTVVSAPTNIITLPDDALTNSTVFVADARPVVGTEVAVRIEHPRVSDLALHLVSPQGTRLLLGENRGGYTPYGLGASVTNILVSARTSQGGPEEDVNDIETGALAGTVKIDYDFYEIPDTLKVRYQGAVLYDSGLISGSGSLRINFGPGTDTKVQIIVNEGGNAQSRTLWTYTATVVTEQILYTVFTENTNRTTIPFKFADTPFTPSPSLAPLLFSSFEVPPGDYFAGSTVDGWSVDTNFVAVMAGGAFSGANYLSIVDSAVSRVLPTRGGKSYTLQFSYRKEVQNLFGTGVDDNRALLPPGAVDPHYRLRLGAQDAFVVYTNEVPSYWVPNSPTSQWIASRATNINRIGPGPFFYRTHFNLAGLDTNTVRIEGKMAVDYEVMDLLMNGQSQGFRYMGTSPMSPVFLITNGFQLGMNYIDFLCTNRATAHGFRTELQLTGNLRPGLTNSTPFLALGGILTNQLNPRTVWDTGTLRFVAPTDNTPLTVAAGVPGLRLDTVVLGEVGDTWYQPEESLETLIGESALGEWHLEVTDRRTGLPVPAKLINWELRLSLARTNPPALMLTNRQCETTTLGAGQMKHFYVEVPRVATLATNTFTADGDLALFFNQAGLTVGGGPGDTQLLPPGTEYVLSTNGVPPLLPGQRYYLGVTNREPAGTNTFTLCVAFDRADETTIFVPELRADVLTTNTIPATNALQYYQYTVGTAAARVSFQLIPYNGNVDLYVRKAEPVLDPLPTPFVYDFASTLPGLAIDQVDVDTNSAPPLVPGVWYLGVLNRENYAVDYGLLVTELSTNQTGGVLVLTNNVPVNFTQGPTPPITNYFLFSITDTNPVVQFDLYNLSGPAELLVEHDARPTPQVYFLSDPGAPDAPAKIVIRTNSFMPVLNGDWYLAVLNPGATNLNYTIKASLPPARNPVIPLANGAWFTNTIAAHTPDVSPVLDYYRITVPDTALLADFELEMLNGNADLYVLKGPSLPEPLFADFFGENPGLTPEWIRARVGDPAVPLAPGDWNLGVYNREYHSITYRVRATHYSPTLTPLANDERVTNTLAAGPLLDYYRYTVSDRVNTVWFDLGTFGGNARLYARYEMPLPDANLFDYTVAASGLPPVAIVLTNGSVPMPLTPGDWYLAVENADSAPVTYVVHAADNTSGGSPPLAITSTRLSADTRAFGFSWTAPPGMNFQVQMATSIPPDWVTLPGVISSADGNYTFTEEPLPDADRPRFRLYRLLYWP